MVRINDVVNALLHVVGWDKEFGSESLVSDVLHKSESGLYFQQMHPLLTLSNLQSIAPQFEASVNEYSNAIKYAVGDLVSHDGKVYRALKASKGALPSADASVWMATNPFSEWLEAKTKASIAKVINRFCEEKIADGSMKTLCERKILFTNTGRLTDVEPNSHNMVGFEINSVRSLGVTTKIDRIGLQFTKPGTYKIYLMQSGRNTPYREFTFTKTQANTMEWFELEDCYLPFFDKDIDAGGSWYLCYAQSELPEGSQAIRKNYDWSNGPCSACSRMDTALWRTWTRYLEINPFWVNEEIIGGAGFGDDFNEDYARPKVLMWDIENNMYRYDTNFGLNLEISVSCDVSDFIISQRNAFANVIGKQLAVDMLGEFVYNPNERINRASINARPDEIRYEMDGDSTSPKKSGIRYELEQAYKALKVSTEGMDRVCMPCKTARIRYGSI